jgi:hypothetical protein
MRNLIGCCRECHNKIHSGEIHYMDVEAKALYWDICSQEDIDYMESDKIAKIPTHELVKFHDELIIKIKEIKNN